MEMTYAGIIQRFHHWLGHGFLRALGVALDKIEGAEWSRKGIQREWSIRSVQFYVCNHPRKYARPVRRLPKSRGIQPSSKVRICR